MAKYPRKWVQTADLVQEFTDLKSHCTMGHNFITQKSLFTGCKSCKFTLQNARSFGKIHKIGASQLEE